jgi:hypothetical protein
MPIVTLNADCYFQYQSSNDPITTNWYFEYQLVLRIPIVTSNTNCYFKYQLLLQIPIVTSNTNCYFKYQLLLWMPWVTIHQEQEQQQQQSGYKIRASTTCSRLKITFWKKLVEIGTVTSYQFIFSDSTCSVPSAWCDASVDISCKWITESHFPTTLISRQTLHILEPSILCQLSIFI